MAKDNKKKSSVHDAAKELGHLGGLKGGRARAESLSAEERSHIASLAAKSRWKNAERAQEKPSQKLRNAGKKKKK